MTSSEQPRRKPDPSEDDERRQRGDRELEQPEDMDEADIRNGERPQRSPEGEG